MTANDAAQLRQLAVARLAAFRKYNGRTFLRGGQAEQLEGTERPRNVVIEFDYLEDAIPSYYSDFCCIARAE